MRRSFRLALSLALCAAATLAFAQKGPSFRFKWKDGAGQAHYSDTLTTDAMKYGYDVVNDAGLVVQPSVIEEQPRSLLAALAAGIPVIATPACGILPKLGITLIPENDPEALVEAILAHTDVPERIPA